MEKPWLFSSSGISFRIRVASMETFPVIEQCILGASTAPNGVAPRSSLSNTCNMADTILWEPGDPMASQGLLLSKIMVGLTEAQGTALGLNNMDG